MDKWEEKALKNILQAHGIDDCDEDETEYYLSTNQFYDTAKEVKNYYGDDIRSLLKSGDIIKTNDGYVAKNIV